MMETQQQDVGKQLQDAVMQAAINDAAESAMSGEKAKDGEKGVAVSPRSGAVLPPGTGRPKGVKNKLTSIRDAVIEAFDQVGGAQYLVKLANGTQSDRAAFSSLVAKVLPTQINQTVDGGIRLELSWLGSRSIGSTQAQLEGKRVQVLDLAQENDGSYRIKDQEHTPAGGADGGSGGTGQAEQTAQNRAGDAQDEGK